MSLIQQDYAKNETHQMTAPLKQAADSPALSKRAREGLSNLAFGWLDADAASRSTALRRLSWLVPVSMFLLVVAYQLGPARWIHTHLGYPYHIAAEIIVFGTAGPLVALGFSYLLRRWLEERDTSELQSQLLERARAEAKRSRELNDDALQVLFAAGAMLDALKAAHPALDEDLLLEMERTEEALQTAVQQLHSRLMKVDALAEGPAGVEGP